MCGRRPSPRTPPRARPGAGRTAKGSSGRVTAGQSIEERVALVRIVQQDRVAKVDDPSVAREGVGPRLVQRPGAMDSGTAVSCGTGIGRSFRPRLGRHRATIRAGKNDGWRSTAGRSRTENRSQPRDVSKWRPTAFASPGPDGRPSTPSRGTQLRIPTTDCLAVAALVALAACSGPPARRLPSAAPTALPRRPPAPTAAQHRRRRRSTRHRRGRGAARRSRSRTSRSPRRRSRKGRRKGRLDQRRRYGAHRDVRRRLGDEQRQHRWRRSTFSTRRSPKAGTFTYHCKIHSSMKGTVTVS